MTMLATSDDSGDWPVDPSNPYAVFNSLSEILAFAFASEGIEFVAQLLAAGEMDRLELRQAAAELESIGLTTLAAVLKKAAKRAPMPSEPLTMYQEFVARRAQQR